MSDDEDYLQEDESGGEEYPDDDDGGDDLGASTGDLDFKPPSLSKQKSFQVFDQERILNESQRMMKEVQDVLSLPNTAVAAALLQYQKWNKERLIERYMEDPEKMCREAGVSSLMLEKPLEDGTKVFACLICFEELPASETWALGCGHRYCRDCWRVYLELKVKEGPDCVYARCMNPKCNDLVHEEAYKKYLTPELYKIYQKFSLKAFVETNAHTKYCPAPSCNNVVRCDRKTRKEAVSCLCSFRFCFRCCDYNIGDHMPATCENIESWQQKASDESENVKWMLANTKKCPQCRRPIEKNGGCMHMTCRTNAGGCGFEFCWLCRGDWKEHGSHTGGYYNCNKYEASGAKKEDEDATSMKTELELYMWYYHRFESHRNARKVADEQTRNAEKKGAELETKFQVRSTDTKFLREAAAQLIENRRALENSYIFGFYLKQEKGRDAERNLFEFLQEDLEKHTNHLSDLYELAVDKIVDYQKFISWKEEVSNYTRVNKKFLDKFVEGVTTGLTAGGNVSAAPPAAPAGSATTTTGR